MHKTVLKLIFHARRCKNCVLIQRLFPFVVLFISWIKSFRSKQKLFSHRVSQNESKYRSCDPKASPRSLLFIKRIFEMREFVKFVSLLNAPFQEKLKLFSSLLCQMIFLIFNAPVGRCFKWKIFLTTLSIKYEANLFARRIQLYPSSILFRILLRFVKHFLLIYLMV